MPQMNKYTSALTYGALFAASMLVGGCSKPPEAAAPDPTSTPTSLAVNVSDTNVSEHVKTALHQSEMLKGFEITVATTNSDVRLNGVVGSQAQIDEAIKIARAADGAHVIHDELTIKK